MPQNKQVDEWFESLSTEQKPILTALRKLINSTAKSAAEEFKWNRPCYSTDNDLFCYLHSTKNHATLGFHRGNSLDDPNGLLEGTGKAMRHIKFKVAGDIDKPAIIRLLKQAAKL